MTSVKNFNVIIRIKTTHSNRTLLQQNGRSFSELSNLSGSLHQPDTCTNRIEPVRVYNWIYQPRIRYNTRRKPDGCFSGNKRRHAVSSERFFCTSKRAFYTFIWCRRILTGSCFFLRLWARDALTVDFTIAVLEAVIRCDVLYRYCGLFRGVLAVNSIEVWN